MENPNNMAGKGWVMKLVVILSDARCDAEYTGTNANPGLLVRLMAAE